MRRTHFALIAVIASGSLLGGCGFMHRHFSNGNDAAYKKAVEERPLEVPPDLDTPNSSGALVVPAQAAAAKTTGTATAASAPPSIAASAAGNASAASVSTAPPAAPGVSLGGDGLHVADTVTSTWSRVGLALERSGVATVQSRDEAAHAYTVETTGQTTTQAGWFKRAITLGHAGNKVTAKVHLTVRVGEDGTGSRVTIEGAGDSASQDAAKSLMEALRQRLS